MIREFKQFLLRGSVVDLAVGVVIGAAFNALITSLVSNLLTPLLAGIVRSPDFSRLSFTLGDNVIMYGNVLNALATFVLVSGAIFFFVVKPMNVLISRSKKGPTIDPATKKCTECLSEIPREARRCAFCTSDQTPST
jgi:large conductance mechanosensitive channel